MAKEKNIQQGLPKEIQLKKKLIICPKCKTKIEIDLTIDISPVSELFGAFQAMNNPEKDDNKS